MDPRDQIHVHVYDITTMYIGDLIAWLPVHRGEYCNIVLGLVLQGRECSRPFRRPPEVNRSRLVCVTSGSGAFLAML